MKKQCDEDGYIDDPDEMIEEYEDTLVVTAIKIGFGLAAFVILILVVFGFFIRGLLSAEY